MALPLFLMVDAVEKPFDEKLELRFAQSNLSKQAVFNNHGLGKDQTPPNAGLPDPSSSFLHPC